MKNYYQVSLPVYSESAFDDYSGLRGLANSFKRMSYFAIVLIIIGVGSGLTTIGDSFSVGTVIIVLSLLFGSILYTFLKVIAESIFVLLDIEANSRRSAIFLEKSIQQ